MPQATSTKPCPACTPPGETQGSGKVRMGDQVFDCPLCNGAGVHAAGEGLPVPFWYPFNLTLLTTAVPGPPPVSATPSAQATQQVASESDFEWIQTLGEADAAEFIQLFLQDVSSNFNFSPTPINFNLFTGDGKLPFTTLENYLFGRKTQLQLTASTVLPPAGTQVIGVGTGAIATWTGVLPAPILPGSVSITDLVGTGVDDGNGGITANAGVVGGTVNYQTGAVSITFVANTVAANNVTATFQRGLARNAMQVALYGFLLVGKKGAAQE